MVYSMTGFASQQIELPTATGSVSATVSLKTLNARFAEVTAKIPYALMHLETDLIKLCKEFLKRGNIYLTIYLPNSQALKTVVVPSLTVAHAYKTAILALQKELNLPGELTLQNILALPNIFETSEETLAPETDTLIIETVKKLLETVLQERAHEGIMLFKDLEARMALIQKTFTEIEPRAQALTTQRQEHLIKTITGLVGTEQAEGKEQQLYSLYHNLEKIDVHEEITRFKNHCEHFLQTLGDATSEKGKKLDFIVQELLREINTLNAKFADTQTSAAAITIKVELEKAREQIQNIV